MSISLACYKSEYKSKYTICYNYRCLPQKYSNMLYFLCKIEVKSMIKVSYYITIRYVALAFYFHHHLNQWGHSPRCITFNIEKKAFKNVTRSVQLKIHELGQVQDVF